MITFKNCETKKNNSKRQSLKNQIESLYIGKNIWKKNIIKYISLNIKTRKRKRNSKVIESKEIDNNNIFKNFENTRILFEKK